MVVVTGKDYRVEIDYQNVILRTSSDDTEKAVKTQDVESVTTLPNGQTKIVVRLHRDVVIPTSRAESSAVTVALNKQLVEWRRTKLNRKLAARGGRKVGNQIPTRGLQNETPIWKRQ